MHRAKGDRLVRASGLPVRQCCFGRKLHRGWGYSDYYFFTYVGYGYFLGFKILNFNIFRGFSNEYFWGTKILWIFFG